MQGDFEPTTLSEDERRILATIEAEFDRDAGCGARHRRRLDAGGDRLTLLGVDAIVAGGVLMVATFATSLLLAAAGVVLMGLGGAAVASRAEVAAGRLGGFLGRSVDSNGAPRQPGLRDETQ